MSELTKCNYCSLRDMEKRAKKRGVTVVLGREDGMISARYSDEDEPSRWFVALTAECVC